MTTVVACKMINGNFEIKYNELLRKEKKLVESLQSLRDKRKELARKLEDLKTFLKAGIKTEAATKPQEDPKDLRGWLVHRGILSEAQFLSAEIYATEKNIDVIAALLTLNMVSIELYEEAKKLNLL
ncbi:hypothetical protein [Desulfovibrio sp. JC022]|uniref:hypothetical protein n=1 Tax=Desulfovibrio sp. JC022 TaxID=2593642 RepID=UPI0013CFF0A5|nr:hypothetical protein [Desulfovibrio sp. JC022]NDV23754.1 hypothetical protein [Desulfovibrio sp. JC022]